MYKVILKKGAGNSPKQTLIFRDFDIQIEKICSSVVCYNTILFLHIII